MNWVLLIVTGYFIIRKCGGPSVSEFVGKYLSPLGVGLFVNVSLFVVGYCVLVRLVAQIIEYFDKSSAETIEPDALNHCCLKINQEIEAHLIDVRQVSSGGKIQFVENHNFAVNVRLIVETLAEHMRESLKKSLKVKRKDLFISVYEIPESWDSDCKRDRLKYVTHYDPKRDLVGSMEIDLNDKRFKGYECVKCIKGKHISKLLLDCEDYKKAAAKSSPKRLKTLKHYAGFLLREGGEAVGFFNIEFHNHTYFSDEDDFYEYVETDLIAFKFLLEYQFLKRNLFRLLEKEINGAKND
tara:strand:- start:366 stop:1256 length:891 start_codon:yes stop_codon:yes gene_type:complete